MRSFKEIAEGVTCHLLILGSTGKGKPQGKLLFSRPRRSTAPTSVAQVYLHQRSGSASRPVGQLEGFRRISLKPGETQTVSFELGKSELGFCSPQTGSFAVEASTFDIGVGKDLTER